MDFVFLPKDILIEILNILPVPELNEVSKTN